MKTRIRTQIVSFFGLPFLFFLILGCWGSSPTALPDAPPPYPDSPFPKGSQTGTYSPPPSPDPYGRDYENRKNSTSRNYSKKNLSSQQTASYDNLYSIEAIGTIWVLIQDKFGNELQWVSLMAGDKIPLNHNGPLTITCSSGESLKITDPKGKLFTPAGLKKGITIIRLP
ncbi:MAG: hypothetical protein P8O23_03290 [Opitutales bacterium]|nr:hypothetical protein [Opitutales bacterium]